MSKKTLAAQSALFAFYLLIVFAQTFLSGQILACEDGRVQNYPAFEAPVELWSPLILCGWPVLADPQVSSFYPVRWLCSILPGGFNCYIFSGYLLSMIFASLFAYRLTARFRGGKGSTLAAAMAGVVYGGGGFLFSELNHVQVVQTAAWLPLLFLFVDEILAGAVWLSPLFALALACSFFAGHPQSFFYSLVALLAYIFLGFPRLLQCAVKDDRRRFIFLFGSLAAGAMLCGVQLLPSVELTRESARAAFGFAEYTFGSLTYFDYLGFLFPYLLGGHYGTLGAVQVVNQGVAPGYFFFGFTPLLLSIYIVRTRFREPVVRFFFFLFWFAVLFSLGERTPLAWLLYHVPGFVLFRAPYRIIVLAALAISMLTALAIAQVERKAERAGAVFQLPFARFLKQRTVWKHLSIMFFTVACGVSFNFLLSAASLIWFSLRPRLATARWALVLATALALIVYARHADWTRQTQMPEALSPPASTQALKDELGDLYRCFSLLGIEAGHDEMPPNLSRLWGIANASGYEPLMSRRYADLLDISEAGFMKPPWRIEAGNRAFDLAAVKLLIAPKEEVGRSFIADEAKQFWTAQEKGALVYFRNGRALPRFFQVFESRIFKADEILRAARTSLLPDGMRFDPRRQVLLETHAAPVLGGDNRAPTTVPTTLPTTLPTKINWPSTEAWLTIDTDATLPGYLVMLDQYYPGFRATVDGQPSPIYRADYCFRAIYLTAGKHRVKIVYEPDSLRYGIGISILGLIFCVALTILSKGKSTPRVKGAVL